MVRKTLTLSIAAAAFFTAAALSVDAASSTCQVIYGGGEVCPPDVKITVDKKVQTPTATKGGQAGFVDNLSVNDAKFAPGQSITYRITVKNVGSDTLKNVVVADTLPQHITLNDGSRTYNKTIAELKANQTEEITLNAKVVGVEALPKDQNVICDNTTNTVQVRVDNATFTDSAQVCVEKKVLGSTPAPGQKVQQTPPMKQTPATGPEMLSLAALIPAGATGIFLRRKSK